MLDKAIATLASVGAEVYPDFNVFEVAKPYARGLLADRFQPRVVLRRARMEAEALGSVARELPYQVSDVLERMRDGTFQIRLENPGLDQLDEHIDQASNRLSVALVVLGGLVGSSIVGVFAEEGPQIMGLHAPLVPRLRPLGRVRALADVGRPPARSALSGPSGHGRRGRLRNAFHAFCRKGHLVPRLRRG